MLKEKILSLFSYGDLMRAVCKKRKEEVIKERVESYIDSIMDAIDSYASVRGEDVFRECFKDAVDGIRCKCSHEYDGISDLELLKSFRKIVSMDLSYSNIARFVYKQDRESPNCCFPEIYYDKKNNKHIITAEKKQVKVKDKYVIEIPHDTKKWADHLKRRDSLDPEKCINSGLPRFYPELNIILQGEGCIHRTAEAFVNERDGEGLVWQYDIRPLFEHVKTDGANWINIHKNEVIRPVGDYRLALIFWIKQKELEVEKAKSLQK